MKKLFIFVLSLVIMTSCVHQKVVTTCGGGTYIPNKKTQKMVFHNGNIITKKEYDKILHRDFKKALNSLSKEERRLLLGSNVKFEYETKQKKD